MVKQVKQSNSNPSPKIYLCECGQVHIETRYHRVSISVEEFIRRFSTSNNVVKNVINEKKEMQIESEH